MPVGTEFSVEERVKNKIMYEAGNKNCVIAAATNRHSNTIRNFLKSPQSYNINNSGVAKNYHS